MIEHTPWRGPDRKLGINRQTIAIVGYSHHGDGSDGEDFTIDTVCDVISGKLKGDSFFAAVRGYFGYDDNAAFWNRMMFFNFLPNCVGTTDQRYNTGSSEQIEHARRRFLRLIGKDKPDKVFVFTTKGWRAFPQTRQQEAGQTRTELGPEFPAQFSWGTYAAGDHIVMAFGLRHPQFASGQLMRRAVQHILAMQLHEGFSE